MATERMTEAEAWRRIGHDFETAAHPLGGLLTAINLLYAYRDISSAVHDRMRARLDHHNGGPLVWDDERLPFDDGSRALAAYWLALETMVPA